MRDFGGWIPQINSINTMARVTRQMIVAALCQAFARPPAQAGMRLRPERELAVLFKVSRPTLRLALAELEEQGILAPQQGSGNYLRCLPQTNGHHPWNTTVTIPPAEQLFVLEDVQKNIAAVDRRTRLKLQLWTHLHRYTSSLRLQLESFAEAAAASGHDLEVTGASTDERVYLPRKKIAAMLRASPCDGYLLDTLIADHALAEFEATGKPFIVFSGAPPVRHEPALLVDDTEAIQRAVALLAREGYRRVALLSYAATELDLHQFNYARAMRLAGLNYHCHLTADVESPDESRRLMLLQLRAAEPPDAIYVSDDNLLPGVALALRDAELTPGRDFGLITMAVKGLPLPEGVAWSQMQFRPRRYARAVLDNLLSFMQSSDHGPNSEALFYHWIPGDSHCRRAAKPAGRR